MRRLYLCFALLVAAQVIAGVPKLSRGEIDRRRAALVDSLAARLGGTTPFTRDSLERIFADPRSAFDAAIFEPRPEQTFTFLFGDSSVERGRTFLREHRAVLEHVAKAFRHVTPELLVALLRIESNFGEYLGEHRVLRVLYTRYLVTPPRERKRVSLRVRELVCFLSLCREEEWDPFAVVGSWAGAIGLPQFMPCSFAFVWDGDGAGEIDLAGSVPDAAWSIGNFLWEHGAWQKDGVRRAVWRYCSKSDAYVGAAFRYATLLTEPKRTRSSSVSGSRNER